MSDHDEIISQFTSMTGCDTERAQFYLESSNWDIGPALETYFDSGAHDAADVGMDEDDIPPGPRQPHGQVGLARPTGDSKSQAPPVVNPPSSSARIATFSSIRKPESEDDSDEERDKDDEQEFYVGSGQEVLGPGKKRNPDELISSIFKSARQHGAEQVDESSTQPVLRTGQPRSFGGSGMRLGDSSGSGAPNAAVLPPVEGTPAESHNPIVTLRMWRNGFTINDGQVRLYADPANHQFMESVKQGRVPPELLMAAKGRELRVQMEDKRDQEFQAPKRQAEYFGGAGHMLGSPAPGVISKPSVNAQSQPSDSEKKTAEEKAKSSVTLDSTQPATNIQIRLPDGSRLVNRFNEAHTVADIRRFIQLARPEFASHNFQMLAGFPSKPLADENASLKDANLLNAAINVK